MLVDQLHPIGATAEIFRDLEISLRRQSEIAKVVSSLTSGSGVGGFDMEWMVSAWYKETEKIRTWDMWFYWNGDAWVIDRRLTESSDLGEVYLFEFDDLRASDADLGVSLVAAGRELASLNPGNQI